MPHLEKQHVVIDCMHGIKGNALPNRGLPLIGTPVRLTWSAPGNVTSKPAWAASGIHEFLTHKVRAGRKFNCNGVDLVPDSSHISAFVAAAAEVFDNLIVVEGAELLAYVPREILALVTLPSRAAA